MNKLSYILIILSLFICGPAFICSPAWPVEKQSQSEVDFARKAIKDGFYDLAENKLSGLLASNVSEDLAAEVHLLLGRVYYEKGLSRKALQEFGFILESFRGSNLVDAATYWIAEVYFKEGNYEEALAAYSGALLLVSHEDRFAEPLTNERWTISNQKLAFV